MKVQELRNWEKLKTQSYNAWHHGHGRTKTKSKEPVFLGRLFSSPLRWYIFHWVSTKRGRSIFYHKGLWTQSHVYAGQHTKQLNCLNSGLQCNKSRLSISALRLKRRYRESKKSLNCLSKERKAYGGKKTWECFYQRDNTKEKFCRSALTCFSVMTSCIMSRSLKTYGTYGLWTLFKSIVNGSSTCENLKSTAHSYTVLVFLPKRHNVFWKSWRLK